jgi:endonuclease I
MKKIGLLTKLVPLSLLLLTLSFSLHAAPKSGFYSSASNLSGYELKTELKNIIKRPHRGRGYGSLMNVYFQSDADRTYDNDGSIVDMYSERPASYDGYTFANKKQKCGNYKKEADCFNREHIFPQSIFRRGSPMRSDIFHVFPTDGYVNGKRSSFPFGEVSNPKWVSSNGSKLGVNTTPGYTRTVFEPIDEFKGDIARALLYFATRYEDRIANWSHAMLNGTSNQVYETWFIKLLLKWHKMDPVCEHEVHRNDIGEKFQGNRNPFIDNPEMVAKIWGHLE